jgi:hypothetical protein
LAPEIGEGLVGVHFPHDEPRRIRDAPNGGQNLDPSVIFSLNDALDSRRRRTSRSSALFLAPGQS